MDTVSDGRGQDDKPRECSAKARHTPFEQLVQTQPRENHSIVQNVEWTLVMITSGNHATMDTTAIARGGRGGVVMGL